jgi:hypothetical protein
MQKDGVTGFHVHGAAAVQHLAVVASAAPAGKVVGDRDGVEMPGQQHPAGRPSRVRASTALPARTISKPDVCARSAASTSSAMRASCRDSLGMSTSAAVSSIGSPPKSNTPSA